MKFTTFYRQAISIQNDFENYSKLIKPLAEIEQLSRYESNQVKYIYNSVKKDYDNFTTLLNKLLSGDVADFDEEKLSDVKSAIQNAYIQICALAETLVPLVQTANSDVSLFKVTGSNNSLRLPKISIKPFSGELQNWLSFINLFNTTIHMNDSLSDVEKFQYLISSVKNEAFDLIKSLALTAENYQVAYAILVKRYQNNRKLLSLHLNNVLELPNIVSHSSSDLKQFLNKFEQNKQALDALKHNIVDNNPLLVLILLKKLTRSLREKFEISRGENTNFPTVQELITFLEQLSTHTDDALLELTSPVNTPDLRQFKNKNKINFSSHKPTLTLCAINDKPKCFCCNQTVHNLYNCENFKKLNVAERNNFVRSKKLCVNCLSNLHTINACNSKNSCFTCNRRHHTLLHYDNVQKITPPQSPAIKLQSSQPANDLNQNSFVGITKNSTNNRFVLLATALVKFINPQTGNYKVLRCVLDCASQVSFITQKAAHQLNVTYYKTNHQISGVNQTMANCKGVTYLSLQNLSEEDVAIDHPIFILDSISENLPQFNMQADIRDKTKHLILADPSFSSNGPIHGLLGCDLFSQIYEGQKINLGENLPVAHKTIFGYVILGSYWDTGISKNSKITTLCTLVGESLNQSLTRFWEQENIHNANKISPEDQFCEDHFLNTYKRDESGRFQLRLPFRSECNLPALGNSYTLAKIRFLSVEKKLNANPELKKLYVDFMQDYIEKGHMELCSAAEIPHIKYIIPHHGVLKLNSSTTKLRVVFDASAPTSSGVSLNDLLLPGPKLHNEIFDILTIFRLYNYVFSCDIQQMFRQIKIHPEDQMYQVIFWRENADKPLQLYKLKTVTYGLKSSPFLAIRVLQQLVIEESDLFPAATEVLRRNCFVDNIFGGHGTEDKALQLQQELIRLLERGGFLLRKWSSNSQKLLQALPSDYYETPLTLTPLDEPKYMVLGLLWTPNGDAFSYSFNKQNILPTKRNILSQIAKLYDPCGLIGPVILWAKCFMQTLWCRGLDWDSKIPIDLLNEWNNFYEDLSAITKITVPRSFFITQNSSLELHGFCDASEKAYAAVVYLRNIVSPDNIKINLIASKTRVAPLKKISLPRLELCAAHLLAKLLSYIQKIVVQHYKIKNIFAWTDSTVTLAWIQTPAYKLNTYVGNRVAEIQELISPHFWRHVKGIENPADCASRGLTASQLVDHKLWWGAMPWLRLSEEDWPKPNFSMPSLNSLPEFKNPRPTALVITNSENEYFNRFSSWGKLLRVYAYVLRFINNSRKINKNSNYLTTNELHNSILVICKIVQQTNFMEELCKLSKNKQTAFHALTPILDENGILRVGGRLTQSNLNFEQKHPIIMPKNNHVTNLIIDYYHAISFHAGPQLLQSIISQRFWIISARRIIRSRLRLCTKCFRCKPTHTLPLMADLPAQRVNPSKPFQIIGCDFGGPYTIKIHTLRSAKLIKAYICVFVCFATKAIHIEVVTDLTTESYIAALKRFFARRGYASEIHCDCGTNFIGANNELRRIIKEFHASQNNRIEINNFCTPHNIKFNFLPPASPHRGGLWESAIRSFKYHLRRVMGESTLSLEEFITLATQIEAMLNSRPLTPLSQDIEDLSVLTPGHFLVGSSLVQVPEKDITDLKTNRLKRWQLVQAFTQRIWKKWTQEYLHTLQQRLKWKNHCKNLNVGDLVLIKKENTAPFQWPLGRVITVHPGKDHVVRSAAIKTASGVIVRSTAKLFTLPAQ